MRGLALGLGSRQAGLEVLDDHGALKFGKYAHHLEHGLARRRRSIEPLLVQVEIDALDAITLARRCRGGRVHPITWNGNKGVSALGAQSGVVDCVEGGVKNAPQRPFDFRH